MFPAVNKLKRARPEPLVVGLRSQRRHELLVELVRAPGTAKSPVGALPTPGISRQGEGRGRDRYKSLSPCDEGFT